MDDIVGYILILGLIVLPGYAIIKLGLFILRALYENQSMILSLPFP